jgi:hypothetical protein
VASYYVNFLAPCKKQALFRPITLSRPRIHSVNYQLLKPLPYFRHKIFSREEVEQFLSGRGGDIRQGDTVAKHLAEGVKHRLFYGLPDTGLLGRSYVQTALSTFVGLTPSQPSLRREQH